MINDLKNARRMENSINPISAEGWGEGKNALLSMSF